VPAGTLEVGVSYAFRPTQPNSVGTISLLSGEDNNSTVKVGRPSLIVATRSSSSLPSSIGVVRRRAIQALQKMPMQRPSKVIAGPLLFPHFAGHCPAREKLSTLRA
jgi:hypothetical protein